MRRILATGAALILAAAAGCGGPRIAPVSGVVYLGGEPYKNAVVGFTPIGTKSNPNPGRWSVGVTDEQGRFTLKYDNERPGALVGKHQVRITTKYEGPKTPEPIPWEWNQESKQQFDVPPAGTDQAIFKIETKRGKKKK